jgi:ABC-type sugar transport system substrate-binding protein
MRETAKSRKVFALAGAAALAVAVLAAPAAATPPDENGEHKVTICHFTNSDINQWVVIEVDVAAFDGYGANDHTRHGDVEWESGACGGST